MLATLFLVGKLLLYLLQSQPSPPDTRPLARFPARQHPRRAGGKPRP